MTTITERLNIGDKDDQPFSSQTAVLNLVPDLLVLTHDRLEYSQIGLIDGPGNKPGTVISAVLVLHQLLERHESVVLVCHGGTGRSGLIAALYLAVRHELKFEAALELVKSKRSQSDPNGDLLKLAPIVIPLLQKLIKA